MFIDLSKHRGGLFKFFHHPQLAQKLNNYTTIGIDLVGGVMVMMMLMVIMMMMMMKH